jgi:hypothetical protein
VLPLTQSREQRVPPKSPAYYRERAEECEKLARGASSPHVGEVMLYVALRWRELADWEQAKAKPATTDRHAAPY